MTHKEKYIRIIQNQYVPVFYRDWYLDVVCEDGWDVRLYYENERVKAAYIFMCKQKIGLKYLINPKFCSYSGIWIFDTSIDYSEMIAELIGDLPTHHARLQEFFPYDFKLPAISGVQYNRYTYIIHNHTTFTDVERNIDRNHRRKINKAKKNLSISVCEDFDVFFKFTERAFRAVKKANPYGDKLFYAVDEVLASHGKRKIIQCENDVGDTVAMAYFIHDDQWVYNYATAIKRNGNHYGMYLLLWEEIKTTIEGGKSFNFEGSMIPGISDFYKRFGGEKVFYPSMRFASNGMVKRLITLKNPKAFD